MSFAHVIEADLTWIGDRFESRVQIAVDRVGCIEAVGPLGRLPDVRLHGQALLPGFVNVHSHAFQRGLRGRGERFPAGAGSFWTWRAEMYAMAARLDADSFYATCRQTFREMLRSGITTVGEFHYFHHPAGTADWTFDDLVVRAARDTGIRLVLLNTYYRTGGIGRALEPAQRRFDAVSGTAYWERLDRLAETLDPTTQHLGVAVHSVRAASPDDIAALHEEAVRRGLVFHMHVEEQRSEITECEAAFGRRPMALLNDILGTTRNVTAVHCTHTDADDMARYLERGGAVCICPLTEANLGDGIPDLTQVVAVGGRLSLGTDSNARIGMLEEIRWLEYVQRLRGERRGIVSPHDGAVARTLLEIATQDGAHALGLDTGRMTPGALADFAAIDLAAPELAGYDDETLLESLIFGAGDRLVQQTCVGGRWLAG